VEFQSRDEDNSVRRRPEAKFIDLEDERAAGSTPPQPNEIMDLQVKVEELTRSKGFLQTKLSRVESELERKG
jgi:hypothetical protein